MNNTQLKLFEVPQTLRIVDGTNDFTEKDEAFFRYRDLQVQNVLWKIQRTQEQEKRERFKNMTIQAFLLSFLGGIVYFWRRARY